MKVSPKPLIIQSAEKISNFTFRFDMRKKQTHINVIRSSKNRFISHGYLEAFKCWRSTGQNTMYIIRHLRNFYFRANQFSSCFSEPPFFLLKVPVKSWSYNI